MDDKPAIEYHPFGQITLNFDEGPINLRKCRVGDLRFAKDLLEEIRAEQAPQYQALVAEVNELKDVNADQPADSDARDAFRAFAVLLDKLSDLREADSLKWLLAIIERMGDGRPPPPEDWPVELFRAHPVSPDDPMSGRVVAVADILNHWQSRPLASGKISQNGMITEVGKLEPLPPVPSSPPAQP